MGTNKPFILLSVMIATFLLLSACGGDDADTTSASAPAAKSEPAAMPASGGDDIFSSMDIEKAEGVIYQDEIYANWPYN